MHIKPLGAFLQTCESTEGRHLFSIRQWLWRTVVGWLCRAAQLSGQLKLPLSRGHSYQWSLLPRSSWGHKRGYKEQWKEGKEWKKEGGSGESWKNKEREGWRNRREWKSHFMLYCGTLISSHQRKHKDRPQPGFGSFKLKERGQTWSPALAHKWQMKKLQDKQRSSLCYKSTKMLKIRGCVVKGNSQQAAKSP